ncbi:MAG: hypothetical protein ABUK14_06925, partial [Desulfobacteria bacterium]
MLQRAEGGIDLIQKEILPAGLERLPQTEDVSENRSRSHYGAPLKVPVFAFGYDAVIRLSFGATSRRSI